MILFSHGELCWTVSQPFVGVCKIWHSYGGGLPEDVYNDCGKYVNDYLEISNPTDVKKELNKNPGSYIDDYVN